jgi:hypothetical protein
MREKVVLPKFDLPGKQMHPAVKLLWMVGGLMALAVLALGGALWRHHSMEQAEESRKQAEIAAKTAQANAEIEKAKARAEEAKMKVAVAEAEAKAKLAAKAAPSPAGDAKATNRKHSGRHSAKSGSKTTVATKAGGDDKKPAAKSGGKKGDDVVDKLLASFK